MDKIIPVNSRAITSPPEMGGLYINSDPVYDGDILTVITIHVDDVLMGLTIPDCDTRCGRTNLHVDLE